jgi:hypothetical protein
LDAWVHLSVPSSYWPASSNRQRRNSLTAAGYVVLQWTWAALQDRPEQLVDELVKLLSSR